MKIYISGAISSKPYMIAYSQFLKVENMVVNMGHTPVNPMKNGLNKNDTWHEHMILDLILLSRCEAIIMLPGWKMSRGAKIEHEIAKNEKKQIIYLSKL